MASEDTLIGNELRLQLGDGNSPETFDDFCSIFDVAGLGETKPLVDVTTLCDLARVFRNGLKEGAELTIQANFIQGDAQTRDLFQRYQADDLANFRLIIVDSSPAEYFAFRATILSWQITPPIGEKAVMQFGLKISGAVEWVYTP
jgi:hypothetical protein